MTIYNIDSSLEDNRNFTRLLIDIPEDTTQPPRMTFRYRDGSTTHTALVAKIDKIFKIHFRRFNLDPNAGPKRMFWGYVEYEPGAHPDVVEYEEGKKIVLRYAGVRGRLDVARPPWLPPDYPNHPPLSTINPITVRVTISTPSDALNRGWIDFDLHHTYPLSSAPERSVSFACESMIHFPWFDLSIANPQLFADPVLGLLQFSAVYVKTSLDAPNINTATGIAVHVENQDGHATSASYHKSSAMFFQSLRNAMHFKGAESVRDANYQISRGNPFGFGGCGIQYRVRAFRQKGACPGVPVDWYDVADVYRNWLRTRYASGTEEFYRKLRPNRPKNAPADNMDPHTVINNWGLDGAADPDPNQQPSEPNLHKILELHPALNRLADANRSSFAQIAQKLKKEFPAELGVKPEVQLWGIEMAGFYQFICGYPHLADTIHDDAPIFRDAVAEIKAIGAVTTVTTDPLNTIFHRRRYAGHIRWKGAPWTQANLEDPANWEAMIDLPFPEKMRAKTCATTLNRRWVVNENQGPALHFKNAQKLTEFGVLSADLPVIGNAFYRAEQKQICPTEDLGNFYLNQWVATRLLQKGVRIVEFMKCGPWSFQCYRTDVANHKHIAGEHTDTRFDHVIGHGAWFVRRLKAIFRELQQRGAPLFDDGFSSFRLSYEFEPLEALTPFVDQYYSGSELHAYVYSHLVTPMMSPGRDAAGIHPGYREKKLDPTRNARPNYMLHADRDDDEQLPEYDKDMTAEEVAALYAQRRTRFNMWRNACVAYAKANFAVESWGLAPRGYPIGPAAPPPAPLVPWNPADPLAPTNPPTYTYSRCVQETFNLRANIFANGAAAVRGIRIMIPSSWFELPNDYHLPAIRQAVLASRLQIEHKRFFRSGRMLGETRIESVNDVRSADLKKLCAWTDVTLGRSFGDVKPLVAILGLNDAGPGDVWRGLPVRDFISKCWDKQSVDVDVVNVRRIQHRIWESVDDRGVRRVLYAFANLTNSEADVQFVYGRGLEGITEQTQWRRTIHVIGGSSSTAGGAWAGHIEKEMHIPARSFTAVVVEPATA